MGRNVDQGLRAIKSPLKWLYSPYGRSSMSSVPSFGSVYKFRGGVTETLYLVRTESTNQTYIFEFFFVWIFLTLSSDLRVSYYPGEALISQLLQRF